MTNVNKIDKKYAKQSGMVGGISGVLLGTALGGPVWAGIGLLTGGFGGYKVGEVWDKDVEVADFKAKLYNEEDSRRCLKKELETSEKEVFVLKQELNNVKQNKKIAELEIDELGQKLEAYRINYEAANEKIEILQLELNAAIAHQQEDRSSTDKSKKEIIILQQALAASEETQQIASQEIDALRKELIASDKIAQDNAAAIIELRANEQTNIEKLEYLLTKMEKKIDSLTNENFQLQINLDQLCGENARQREEMHGLVDYVEIRKRVTPALENTTSSLTEDTFSLRSSSFLGFRSPETSASAPLIPAASNVKMASIKLT